MILKNTFYVHILLISLFSVLSTMAQDPDSLRFTYNGEDVLRDKYITPKQHIAGFGTSIITDYEFIPLPVMYTIFYEYGTRIVEFGDEMSVSININPQIALVPLFIGRVSATANVNFLNYSTHQSKHKFGIFGGAGWELFASSFNLNEIYPVIRAGILLDNFRILYQTNLFSTFVLDDHLITLGTKIEF